jgi:regulator of protease activity HflC (stomatin/prohibitin superfamily)
MVNSILVFISIVVGLFIAYKGYTKDNRGNVNIKLQWVLWGIVFIFGGITLSNSVGQIKSGDRGVVLRFGAMTGKVLDEGLYIVCPVIDVVEIMSVQVKNYTVEASVASRDMQEVHTKVTLNYQLDKTKVGEIYRDMRRDYVDRVVDPSIQETVKAATAMFNAEELVGQREGVRSRIKELLTTKLQKQYGINVIDISITDFNFSPEFNKAIERKATAVQDAETAKRNLEKVKMEQQAQIVIAQAQAESLRLQKQNVTIELIKLRQIDAQMKMIEKWDGKFPQVMAGGNTPLMLDLGAK